MAQKYKRITVDGRRVKIHIYVMEHALGRRLKRGEVVHHKNHDTFDNRIDNLELMTNSSHSKYHHTLSNHGKWSRVGYEKCTECSTNTIKYKGGGLCERCFARRQFKKHRHKRIKYLRNYYKNNKEKCLKSMKDFYKKNPEKYKARLAYGRDYSKKHLAQSRANKSIYRRRNRQRIREYFRKYRDSHRENMRAYQVAYRKRLKIKSKHQ